MSIILTIELYIINLFYLNDQDVRVDEWPLMSSAIPTVLSCLIYVFMMNVVGPALMKDRHPFKLKRPILLYNLAQIFSNLWLFYEVN